MLYQARAPRRELAPFVRCLWRLRGDPGEIEPQPILPDGCFELILHLGEPFVERESPPSDAGAPPRRGAIETRQERALVAATLTRSVVVRGERLARVGSDRRFDRLVEALIAPEAPTVASLAGAAGISLRQFERWFKSRAGVSAKVLQRVVRFHRVAAGLLDGSLDLAALALDAGFYHQAHMSREFRSLAAVTPARYPERAGALDRLFADS